MAANAIDGSPKMRVPSWALRWLMDRQLPRESLGATLGRVILSIDPEAHERPQGGADGENGQVAHE